MMKCRSLLSMLLLLGACSGNDAVPAEGKEAVDTVGVPFIDYTVVRSYPHDTALFTEGLLVHEGRLFESTGSPGDVPSAQSLVGSIDLKTGKMDKKVVLDRAKYFGEGIAFLKGKLYQLTYKTHTGFVYDAKTFRQLRSFHFDNAEGWGLTTDGEHLIMSDGSARLTYLSPDSLKPLKVLPVTEDGAPLQQLNELEYIKGFIYANVWMSNAIVKIDPATGRVVGKLSLGSLDMEAKAKQRHPDVLNGIAYDAAQDKIYVTGKLWPNIYEISFPH